MLAIVGVLHNGDAASPSARRLAAAMDGDPSLLIYTAVKWLTHWLAKQPVAPETVSTDQLVRWWCDHGVDHFAADEVLRPAPECLWPRMLQLDHRFATLSRSRWFAESMVWIAESSPTIDPSLSGALSSLTWTPSEPSPFADDAARQTLAAIARTRRSESGRSENWSDRVRDHRQNVAKNLAYGLSHEINNPLAAIATRAESLARMTDDAAIQTGLQRIIDQSYRAHAMIADLMFYAHPPHVQKTRFDLSALLSRVVDPLTDSLIHQQIEVRVSVSQPIELHADENMIGDAILAMLQNSIDAIGLQGKIVVEAVDQNEAIRITIADSGPGVTAEQCIHAFDPYYCGREAGRGLGLGLCRVDRIVRLHGGSVQLIAALAGCVAVVRLPKHRDTSRH